VELFVKYFRTAMKWLGIFVVWNIVGLPIACLFALQPMAIGLRDGPIAMLAICLAGTGVFLLTIAVHELGHLFAGLLVGLEPIMAVFGPLRLVREFKYIMPCGKTAGLADAQVVRVSGKFRLRLNTSLFGNAAITLVRPIEALWSRPRFATLIAGGPLANLLTAAICIALVAILEWPGKPLLSPKTSLGAILNIAAFTNLCFMMINLVPFWDRGQRSDGSQLLDCLIGGARLERNLLPNTLLAACERGVRLRDLDCSKLERLLALRDGSPYDATANLFAYWYSLDCGHIEQAGAFLDLATAQRKALPNQWRSLARWESAYFEAYHRRSAREARTWLEHYSNKGGRLSTLRRAEAAVLYAEGQFRAAVLKATEGLASFLPTQRDGFSIAQQDWLTQIMTASEERFTATLYPA
jgi:hypothetical protein